MRFQDFYAQKDKIEIERLMDHCKHCQLLTLGEQTTIGIFNPMFIDGKIYLHLNRLDEQVKALMNFKTICVVEFTPKNYKVKWKLGQNQPRWNA